MLARARGLAASPAASVALLVVVSTAARLALGSRMSAPWIIPDEALYSGLAESLAEGRAPAIHGVVTLTWGLVYPLLIAPAWLAFPPETAYHAALAINAFVMSLAAIPAYALARMFVSRRGALLVASTTLLVPSMAYTGVVMTETAFYPAFLAAVLAVARAVERPSVARQVAALSALGLLALVRPQGVVLAGAYAGCILASGLLVGPGERARYLTRFAPSALFSAAALIAVVGGSWVKGHGALGWLGAHAGAVGDVDFVEVPIWFVLQLSDLLLYTAVAPIAAVSVLALSRTTRTDARSRLYVAVFVPIALTMFLTVALVGAAVDVDGQETVDERYLFYLVPLLLVGLALWIERGLPRPRRVTVIVLALSCVLAVLLPVDRVSYNADFQAFALLPWLLFESWVAIAAAMLAFTVACGLVWARVQPARSGHLWLLVGGWFVIVGVVAHQGMAVESTHSRADRIGDRPSWIDDVAAGTQVAALWDEARASSRPDVAYQALVVNDVFNRSVDRMLRLGPTTYYEHVLPTVPVRLGGGGLVLDGAGAPVRIPFVLTRCDMPVVGDVVARQRNADLVLYRVDPPLRVGGEPSCGRQGAS